MQLYIIRSLNVFSEKMKWKLLLAVLVILGIVTLLFITDTGVSSLNFLKRKVGDFVAVVFKWAPGGKQFYIRLTTNRDTLYGQTYKISNATFEGSGTAKEVKINKATSLLNKVDVKIEGLKGSLEITDQDTVKVSGDAASVVLNNLPILNLNIYVEMVPSGFTLSQFSQEKITLPSVTGEIKTEDGWTRPLGVSNLEIYNFKGIVKLEGNQVVLIGLTSRFAVDGKEVTITSK